MSLGYKRASTSFSVTAYPGQTYHAPIARISHDFDQKTRTMLIELDFHNADVPREVLSSTLS
jgi:hypothetical protein